MKTQDIKLGDGHTNKYYRVVRVHNWNGDEVEGSSLIGKTGHILRIMSNEEIDAYSGGVEHTSMPYLVMKLDTSPYLVPFFDMDEIEEIPREERVFEDPSVSPKQKNQIQEDKEQWQRRMMGKTAGTFISYWFTPKGEKINLGTNTAHTEWVYGNKDLVKNYMEPNDIEELDKLTTVGEVKVVGPEDYPDVSAFLIDRGWKRVIKFFDYMGSKIISITLKEMPFSDSIKTFIEEERPDMINYAELDLKGEESFKEFTFEEYLDKYANQQGMMKTSSGWKSIWFTPNGDKFELDEQHYSFFYTLYNNKDWLKKYGVDIENEMNQIQKMKSEHTINTYESISLIEYQIGTKLINQGWVRVNESYHSLAIQLKSLYLPEFIKSYIEEKRPKDIVIDTLSNEYDTMTFEEYLGKYASDNRLTKEAYRQEPKSIWLSPEGEIYEYASHMQWVEDNLGMLNKKYNLENEASTILFKNKKTKFDDLTGEDWAEYNDTLLGLLIEKYGWTVFHTEYYNNKKTTSITLNNLPLPIVVKEYIENEMPKIVEIYEQLKDKFHRMDFQEYLDKYAGDNRLTKQAYSELVSIWFAPDGEKFVESNHLGWMYDNKDLLKKKYKLNFEKELGPLPEESDEDANINYEDDMLTMMKDMGWVRVNELMDKFKGRGVALNFNDLPIPDHVQEYIQSWKPAFIILETYGTDDEVDYEEYLDKYAGDNRLTKQAYSEFASIWFAPDGIMYTMGSSHNEVMYGANDILKGYGIDVDDEVSNIISAESLPSSNPDDLTDEECNLIDSVFMDTLIDKGWVKANNIFFGSGEYTIAIRIKDIPFPGFIKEYIEKQRPNNITIETFKKGESVTYEEYLDKYAGDNRLTKQADYEEFYKKYPITDATSEEFEKFKQIPAIKEFLERKQVTDEELSQLKLGFWNHIPFYDDVKVAIYLPMSYTNYLQKTETQPTVQPEVSEPIPDQELDDAVEQEMEHEYSDDWLQYLSPEERGKYKQDLKEYYQYQHQPGMLNWPIRQDFDTSEMMFILHELNHFVDHIRGREQFVKDTDYMKGTDIDFSKYWISPPEQSSFIVEMEYLMSLGHPKVYIVQYMATRYEKEKEYFEALYDKIDVTKLSGLNKQANEDIRVGDKVEILYQLTRPVISKSTQKEYSVNITTDPGDVWKVYQTVQVLPNEPLLLALTEDIYSLVYIVVSASRVRKVKSGQQLQQQEDKEQWQRRMMGKQANEKTHVTIWYDQTLDKYGENITSIEMFKGEDRESIIPAVLYMNIIYELRLAFPNVDNYVEGYYFEPHPTEGYRFYLNFKDGTPIRESDKYDDWLEDNYDFTYLQDAPRPERLERERTQQEEEKVQQEEKDKKEQWQRRMMGKTSEMTLDDFHFDEWEQEIHGIYDELDMYEVARVVGIEIPHIPDGSTFNQEENIWEDWFGECLSEFESLSPEDAISALGEIYNGTTLVRKLLQFRGWRTEEESENKQLKRDEDKDKLEQKEQWQRRMMGKQAGINFYQSWYDPKGKEYKLTNTDHADWILSNQKLLKNEYGIDMVELQRINDKEGWSEQSSWPIQVLLQEGWIRQGDVGFLIVWNIQDKDTQNLLEDIIFKHPTSRYFIDTIIPKTESIDFTLQDLEKQDLRDIIDRAYNPHGFRFGKLNKKGEDKPVYWGIYVYPITVGAGSSDPILNENELKDLLVSGWIYVVPNYYFHFKNVALETAEMISFMTDGLKDLGIYLEVWGLDEDYHGVDIEETFYPKESGPSKKQKEKRENKEQWQRRMMGKTSELDDDFNLGDYETEMDKVFDEILASDMNDWELMADRYAMVHGFGENYPNKDELSILWFGLEPEDKFDLLSAVSDEEDLLEMLTHTTEKKQEDKEQWQRRMMGKTSELRLDLFLEQYTDDLLIEFFADLDVNTQMMIGYSMDEVDPEVRGHSYETEAQEHFGHLTREEKVKKLLNFFETDDRLIEELQDYIDFYWNLDDNVQQRVSPQEQKEKQEQKEQWQRRMMGKQAELEQTALPRRREESKLLMKYDESEMVDGELKYRLDEAGLSENEGWVPDKYQEEWEDVKIEIPDDTDLKQTKAFIELVGRDNLEEAMRFEMYESGWFFQDQWEMERGYFSDLMKERNPNDNYWVVDHRGNGEYDYRKISDAKDFFHEYGDYWNYDSNFSVYENNVGIIKGLSVKGGGGFDMFPVAGDIWEQGDDKLTEDYIQSGKTDIEFTFGYDWIDFINAYEWVGYDKNEIKAYLLAGDTGTQLRTLKRLSTYPNAKVRERVYNNTETPGSIIQDMWNVETDELLKEKLGRWLTQHSTTPYWTEQRRIQEEERRITNERIMQEQQRRQQETEQRTQLEQTRIRELQEKRERAEREKKDQKEQWQRRMMGKVSELVPVISNNI